MPDLVVGDLVQQHRDVAPGQLRNNLSRDWSTPRCGEGPHVDQAALGKPTHPRELRTQIGASRPMTLLPHPSNSCRRRSKAPVCQYKPTSSVFTARAAYTREVRT